MKVLVVNAGSSSLKYQLFNTDTAEVLAKGNCERIGAGGTVTHKRPNADNYFEEIELADHGKALERVLYLLCSEEYGVISDIKEIDAVGHRVAHGGEKFKANDRKFKQRENKNFKKHVK